MLDIEKLKGKGWSDYEIQTAMETIIAAEENKHPRMALFEKTLLWIFLLVGVLGNIVFSIQLIPIIAVFPESYSYLITLFAGLVFGVLFTTLLKDIEWLEIKHHLLYSTIIPLAGIVNFVIIINQADFASQILGMGYTHNAFLLGALYLVAFFIPYISLINGVKPWTLKSGV